MVQDKNGIEFEFCPCCGKKIYIHKFYCPNCKRFTKQHRNEKKQKWFCRQCQQTYTGSHIINVEGSKNQIPPQ